jgi:hypothetical protein
VIEAGRGWLRGHCYRRGGRTKLSRVQNIFCDQAFQQTVSNWMGTDFVSLLSDLFIRTSEAEFIEKLLTEKSSGFVLQLDIQTY